MQYTKLGASGLIVSRMCFGTMTFNLGADKGQMYENVAKVDQARATEMVSRCLDAGVNFFDSADGYSSGDAERALGVALRGRRDHAIIATKLGFRQSEAITDSGLSRRHILRSVEGCLNRLCTDVIDLLLVHRSDATTPMEETLAALDSCVQHGKVRYLGFSNWPAWQAARAIQYQRDNGLAPFVAGQLLYNAAQRDVEVELLPMMEAMGAGLMAWSPLSGGLLSGKYDPENIASAGNGRLKEFNVLGVSTKTACSIMLALGNVAKRHNAEIASVALAWIISQRRDHTFIAGASKLAHVEAAVKATQLTLNAEDIAMLNATAPPQPLYPQRFGDGMADAAHTKALA